MSTGFYEAATVRNLGLLNEQEQDVLKNATVAIAGVGAVGGHYLVALARLGVGRFIIADPDAFEVVNIHRQAGAFVNTLGKTKVEAMADMVRQINPDVEIRLFPKAITEQNIAEFLDGADVVLDGIDFFQIDAHRTLHGKARELGLHSITSGPIGYGASLHIFSPNGMSFDEYFGITPNMTRAERIAAFAAGLMPSLRRASSIDSSRIDFEKEKGPALISAVMLCTGIVTTEVLRILLKRGEPLCVPHALYFDPYLRNFTHARRARSGLINRLIRWVAFRRYPSLVRLHEAEKQAMAALPVCQEI